MKLSKYMEISEPFGKKNYRVLFSTKTAKSVLISSAMYHYLVKGAFSELSDEVFENLRKAKVIIEDELDELGEFLSQSTEYIKNNRSLHEVIQPSADCQLGCSYCGQNHRKKVMDDLLADRLVARIENKINTNRYDRLSISWFGGEPLLAISKIEQITKKLKEITLRKGMSYSASITTNGLSLKPSVFNRLVDCDIKEMEITLDGYQDNHDKRRPVKQSSSISSYETILKNLCEIAKNDGFDKNDIKLIIRSNIDKNNFDGIIPLVEDLQKKGLKDNIHGFYLAPVHSWGNDAHNQSLNSDHFAKIEINFMLQLLQRRFKIGALPGSPKKQVCISLSREGEVYDAYGNVFNCTEIPYVGAYENSSYRLGFVHAEASIANRSFNSWNLDVQNGKVPCSTCKILPICGGACPKAWHEGNPPCPSIKFNLKERLLVYAKQTFKQQLKTLLPLLFLLPFATTAQVDTAKSAAADTLRNVTLEEVKKAVQHLPDRTIYDFSQQPALNAGNMMEGLKKLPGVIASESVGIMYQGRSLEVYMDGRPLRISGNALTAFLEGLPAGSIDRIEIITNPGAEYAATSGDAILNIVSARRASDHTTLTYSGSYSFSDEDRFRNKTNNGLFLTSRFRNVDWKVDFGQNYRENMLINELAGIAHLHNDRSVNYRYFRPGLTFGLRNAKIALDYDLILNNLDNSVNDLTRLDGTSNRDTRNTVSAAYQRLYRDHRKKLELRAVYASSNSRFAQDFVRRNNLSEVGMYTFRADYGTPIAFLSESKFNVGAQYDREDIAVDDNQARSVDFRRNTLSSYAELQSKYGPFDLIAGLRGEDYDHTGAFAGDKIAYKRLKFFPNASIQYNIMPAVFVRGSYSKKTRLPSVSQLNPNNVILEHQRLSYGGNPHLRPTVYDNIGIKLSAFDYASIAYDVSRAGDDIMFFVQDDGGKVQYQYRNVPDLTVRTFSFALPIPLMLFTKGFDELFAFNFDLSKINILYFYTDYQKYRSTIIGDQPGIWTYFASGQFILPKEVTLQTIYKITRRGNYRYFLIDKDFQHSFDVSVSRKFMHDRLSVSLFGNDLFDTNRTTARTLPLLNGISTMQKADTRTFGISLSYKILTSKKGEGRKRDTSKDEVPSKYGDLEI